MEPWIYQIALSWAEIDVACPVEDCLGQASSWTALRVHFVHRHMWYIIVFLEEGNLPHL